MLLILIIFVIAFAGAAALAFAVYRQQRALPERRERAELPRQPVTLFADESGASDAVAEPPMTEASLIDRARQGDCTSLQEARHEAPLYQVVLNALIDWCERQGDTAALVRHLARSDDLRANTRLAERVIAAWQAAPDRRSTVDMLHVAALADDANTYRRAVDLAIEGFKNGRLRSFAADELLALFESQFWALNSEAQRGGDGFALKQRLAEARRELTAAASAK
ncbi:MAG TPA: hypothetical protein VKA60_09660 [Blastocatellia bacterium]|nr:hypothetical protein [Blastocatellia bacterium]